VSSEDWRLKLANAGEYNPLRYEIQISPSRLAAMMIGGNAVIVVRVRVPIFLLPRRDFFHVSPIPFGPTVGPQLQRYAGIPASLSGA
jgi:hypothetical protein